MDGVGKSERIRGDVLDRVGLDAQKISQGARAPAFVSELPSVHGQLLAALPRRKPGAVRALLELPRPAAKALTELREKAGTSPAPLRFVLDAPQGLFAVVGGMTGLLLAGGGDKPFPLDLGGQSCVPAPAGRRCPWAGHGRAAAEVVAGPEPAARAACPPRPLLVEGFLGAMGGG